MAAVGIAAAQDSPSPDFIRKTGQAMISADPKLRQAAYRAWDPFTETAASDHRKTLEAALKFHDQRLDKLCRGQAGEKNPYPPHQLAAEELDSERERVLKLIRTDWKKDGRKISELRDEMKSLAKMHAKVLKLAATDTRKFDGALDGTLAALTEITRELERYDEEAESREFEDDADLREELLENNIEGSHLRKIRRRFQRTREDAKRLADVNKANKDADAWASGAMKDFAAVLNTGRDIIGLTPLLLEEKLSDASRGHSEDMARLGFFAHESPVPGKKTPWDRAKLAGYTGSASGENIFMGSTSPQSAYDAWFASDGHRFIMYADGPDQLGVGISGSHWTMMTGSK